MAVKKATEYYQANKDVIKEKANSKYNNLTEEEKEKKTTFHEQIQQNERK